MTRKEALRKITAAALPLYGQNEALSIAHVFLDELCGVSRLELALEPDSEVPWSDSLEVSVGEISDGRPVQYVTGRALFCGMEFRVREGVLIPRPETEELVEWVVSDNDIVDPDILDIGTGSGAIAIALASLIPGSRVSAIDISQESLSVASDNAQSNSVDVSFERADILAAEMGWGQGWSARTYDMIVSNPPYIPHSDINYMHRNVTVYEPHGALFVADNDPLVFYRAIAVLALVLLKENGMLYFEIYEHLGAEVAQLLTDLGYSDIVVKEDINGKQRMARCHR